MKKIIIFASGSGSNAENLIKNVRFNSNTIYWKVFTNNSRAGVIERCKKLNIEFEVFSKNDFDTEPMIKNKIIAFAPDLIILAGFLLKIPKIILDLNYKIINIHPSLLPKFGGKGMYGKNVHNAVLKNNEKESGITIHFVNDKYDEGKIIFQKKVKLDKNENIQTLMLKINELEKKNFPEIVDRLIS